MAGEAVDEGQRQFRERADVEVDHAELLVARQVGGPSDESETGIVDDDLRLELEQQELPANPDCRVTLLEVHRHHDRTGMPRRGDVIGKRVETILPPRHQDKRVAVRRKNPRQLRADAGRSARYQRDRFHGSLPESDSPLTWRRNATRSFDDTPSRSAARQTRLSSSSSRLPSA